LFVRSLLIAVPGDARRRTFRALDAADSLITTARSFDEMRAALGRKPFDLVVLVAGPVASSPSPSLVSELRGLPDEPAVVVVTEHDDAERAAAWVAAGALGVVPVALETSTFRETIREFVGRADSAARIGLFAVPGEAHALADFGTSSPAMREFLRRARRVAEKDSTLLLLGETGVGKGLLARSIHNEGPRSGKPFVAVNCGALSETLLESELFGHEKGAFTSANRARRGYFELAHGGSIFLDEVSELPLHLQVKLLHVLEDRRIQPVGSERSLCVDVRIIAASNRDLLEEVEQGRFRRDLFYRLNVVSLTLPPLRERVEDIEAMARSYLAHFRERQGGDGPDLSDEALEALRHYSWPGNVREFINAIERACILCEGEEVQLTDLPDDLQTSIPVARGSVAPLRFPDQAGQWLDLPWNQVRRQVLESAELAYLTGILEVTGGRVGEAASRAGMDPRSLFQKMRRYGLRKEDFRSGGASERADASAPRVPSTLRGV